MTPGTQSPFFLLLILTVLTAATAPEPTTVVTGSGHTNSTPGGEKETSATQRSSMPISTKNATLHQAQLPLWCTAPPLPGLPPPQPARALHSQFPATTLILLPPLPATAPRLMPVALTIAQSQHQLLPTAAERHF
uniref:Mucin 1, cell surface associated n=1 Tax=Macaca nemestrina TaxID=9545 RepID=A0A2K6B9D7_MACNE